MGMDASELTGMGSVLTGAQGAGGGGGTGACVVDVTAPIQGDGSPGAPLLLPNATAPTLVDPSGASGYMSATQAGELAAVFGLSGWYANRAVEAKNTVPTLAVTQYEQMRFGRTPFTSQVAGNISGNANEQGGCAQVLPGQVRFYSETILQTPKNGDYVFAIGFAMGLLTNPHLSLVGLTTIPMTTWIRVLADTTVGFFQFQLRGTAGADQLFTTAIPLDLVPHNLTIIGHGNQTYFVFDGTLLWTTPNNSNLTDSPVAIAAYCDGDTELRPMCCLWGFVNTLPA